MANKVQIKDLAKFIVLYCNSNEIEINHFKLQKLLYYAQAWHLVYFNRFNLFDELPQAWVNGPVYRSVYDEWRTIYAATGIRMEAKHIDELKQQFIQQQSLLNLDKEQENFLASFLNHYGLFSHERLIQMTHQDSPWNEARRGLGVFDRSENNISVESMYVFYKKILDDFSARQSQ